MRDLLELYQRGGETASRLSQLHELAQPPLKEQPITEAEVNELLPFAGRLIAALAERGEAKRSRESGEQHAIEKEWLWWMLNGTQDPVLLSDQQNNTLLYNIHAERLFQTSPD